MGKKRKSFELELHFYENNISKVYECELPLGETSLTFNLLWKYADTFLLESKIYTEVIMSYLMEDRSQIIDTEFRISFGDIESKYGGLFVVALSSTISFLHTRLDEVDLRIGEVLDDLRQLQEPQDANQLHELVLKQVLSIPEQVVRMVSKVFCDEVLDFALVVAEPLLTFPGDDVRPSIIAESSKCSSGLQRLKGILKKSNQSPLIYKGCLGTRETLIDLFNECAAVLILDVHNEFDDEAYLLFESESLGEFERITETDIRQQLQNIQESQRPQLVVLRSPFATRLARAFIDGGVLAVLAVQAYDFEEDSVIQIFLQTFFLLLLRGDTVEAAFKQSKMLTYREKASRSLSLGTCCCFHPDQHGPQCRQRLLEAEIGRRRCHELYHVPTCKCPRRTDCLHKQTCPWALEALFNLNHQFRVLESDGNARRLFKFELEQLIGQQELLICCCCKLVSEIDHENQRFQLFSADADTVIFKKASDQDLDVEPDMKDKTELQLLKEYHRIERIYGRNNDIVKLMRDIDANRVMVFYGPVGSGRTGLVTKATSYMTERGLLQQDILYLNIGNCSRRVDFHFKFCKTAKLRGNFQTEELVQAYGYKSFLMVLDDCDAFVNNSYNDFVQEIGTLIEVLPDAKILLIICSETERTHSNFLLGQKRLQLAPLNIQSAADLFLHHAKEYLPLRELSIKNVWELFCHENMRYPKTILDMAYFLRTPQSSRSKVDFSTLRAYAQKVQSNLATEDKFLEQNLAELNKDEVLYNLLLLLSQFPNGLSQLDFEIMASHQVEGKYTFVPKNWKQLLSKLLAFNNEADKPAEFMKESDNYYFCLVEKTEGTWKVRAKKYIIDYLQRQGLNSNLDLRFKAVAYLSTLSTVLLRLFREKGQYQERLFEHNGFSNCGFFHFEKGILFAQFFDEGDYYPGRTVNMTRSIMYGRIFDSEVRSIFAQSSALQAIEPYKCLLQHQQNFITLYQTDFRIFYTALAAERRKLFKYYFQNILLNVPTLSKLVGSRVPRSFLQYTMEESIKKVPELEPESISRSNNILIIKLQLMFVDFAFQKLESGLQNYKKLIDEIGQLIKLWPEDSIIHKVKDMEVAFTNLFGQTRLLMAAPKQYGTLLPEILKTIGLFDKLVLAVRADLELYKSGEQTHTQKIKRSKGVNILTAKFHLLLGEFYLKQVTKSKYHDEFNRAYGCRHILSRLYESRDVFLKEGLRYLEVDALLWITRLRLNNPQTLGVQDYMDIYKSLIKPCRKILDDAKVSSNEKGCQLGMLQGTVNRRIWEATRNVMVLMASAPLLDAQGASVPPHGLRRKRALRSMLEGAVMRKLQADKVQKKLLVRFELLTLKNFSEVMNVGCSILIEEVNVSRDKETADLMLHAENEWMPTQERVSVRSFFEKISFNAVELLIISGENSALLAERIEKESSDPPFIISVDHQLVDSFASRKQYNMTDPFLKGYYESCVRTLQTVIAGEFLRLICEQLLAAKKDIRGKDVYQIFRSASEGTLVYSIGFSKEIANRTDFEALVRFRIHDNKHRNLELLFEPGQYHDISSYNPQLHNIGEAHPRLVGRQSATMELITHLQRSGLTNQASLVNIYGPKHSGKTAFVQQCARLLLERGNYTSGIYLLSGTEIDTAYQGDIDEYIEQHSKELFKADYLSNIGPDSEQVLIILDDYHLLKDRSKSLAKFLTTLDEVGVNLIVTSREPLDFITQISQQREILNLQIDKLSLAECCELAYTFIPIYDFNSYSTLYKAVFESLKNKHPDGMLPKTIATQYRRLHNKGARAFAKEAGRYPSYKEYLQYFQQLPQSKLKKHKKSGTIEDLQELQEVLLRNKPFSQMEPSTRFEESPPSKFLKAESTIEGVDYN